MDNEEKKILETLEGIKKIKDEEIEYQRKKLDEFAKVNKLLESIEKQNKNIETLNKSVQELIQPPPIFLLECKMEDKDIQYISNKEFPLMFSISPRLRLKNEGFGIGKNLQIGIIVSIKDKRVAIASKDDTKIKSEILPYMPTNLPDNFREIFEFESEDSEINIMRISDDQVIHSGDFRDYTFDLKTNVANCYLRSNIGIFINCENSHPKYFEIKLDIDLDNTKGRIGRQTEPTHYLKDKIKIINAVQTK